MNEGNVCLADCITTHTILQDKRYFLDLTLINANVSTISGTAKLIEGFGRENIMLPNGTRFHINDALYSSKSIRNLLSFKDDDAFFQSELGWSVLGALGRSWTTGGLVCRLLDRRG